MIIIILWKAINFSDNHNDLDDNYNYLIKSKDAVHINKDAIWSEESSIFSNLHHNDKLSDNYNYADYKKKDLFNNHNDFSKNTANYNKFIDDI